MKKSKDKYACFQWLRDVRAEMSRDMENMTPEETVDYLDARYEKARVGRPQYTLEESRQLMEKYLAEPAKSNPAKPKPRKAAKPGRKAAEKPAARRGKAKRLAHA